jgi:hypothetical protein
VFVPRMPKRIALFFVLAGCLACGAAVPATALAAKRPTIKPSTYKLAIPEPGHVTVAAVEVTVRKHGRGRPPSRVSLTLPNRFGLPDSVRFFYVRRRISVSPLRYELLLLAVNRASGRSSASSARRAPRRKRVHSTAKTQFNAGSIVLQYPSRPVSGHTCGNCAQRLPVSTNCPKRCWFKKATIREVQVVNADDGSSTDLGALVTLLRTAWTSNGDTNPVFGNPSAGVPRDPTLNGGQYNDNRAFGWNSASLRDPGPLFHTVVDDLLTGQPSKIIGDLELIGQADLNGNGQLDASATPGGGTSA